MQAVSHTTTAISPNTGNAPDHLQVTGYRGGAFYAHAPAVTDDGLITAAGTAALEFAMHIFRCLNLYAEGDAGLRASRLSWPLLPAQ